MTCREFADFIMDYQSGELSAELRGRFDHHLALCANCRKYLTSYDETVKLGKAAFDDADAGLTTLPEIGSQSLWRRDNWGDRGSWCLC